MRKFKESGIKTFAAQYTQVVLPGELPNMVIGAPTAEGLAEVIEFLGDPENAEFISKLDPEKGKPCRIIAPKGEA